MIFVCTECQDLFSVATQPKIRVDDRKNPILSHQWKKAARNDMHAGKCKRLSFFRRPDNFWFLIASCSTSAEFLLLVEQQVSRRLAILHGQRRQSLILLMKLHHAAKINRAKH